MMFYINGSLAWWVLVPVPLLAGGALAYTLTGHQPLSPAAARSVGAQCAPAR